MIYDPLVITPPAVEPVSLTEIKAQLRFTASSEDTKLESFIAAARAWFEARTNRTVHETTYEWVIDSWPRETYIKLPRASPLISISSLKYKNSAGTETTWGASNYIADVDSTPGRLVLAYGISWPSIATMYPVNPIRIRYRAGIAITSPVTEASDTIKTVICLLVAGLFENREAEVVSQGLVSRVALKYGIETFVQQLTIPL